MGSTISPGDSELLHPVSVARNQQHLTLQQLPYRGKGGEREGIPSRRGRKEKQHVQGQCQCQRGQDIAWSQAVAQPSCLMAAMGAGRSQETGQEPGWGLE